MLTQRPVDPDRDRDALLELHCASNYGSETRWARRAPYEAYRAAWLASGQPETYLAGLARSRGDPRTIAEMWEDDGDVVGHVRASFHDVEGYGLTFAEIDDVSIFPRYRRRGVGLAMLQRVETLAKERGASWLRSDAGVENTASRALHAKHGFRKYHVGYEKLLVDEESLINRRAPGA